MKNKILTMISTIMLFIPWTILPLRSNTWALESPVAVFAMMVFPKIM